MWKGKGWILALLITALGFAVRLGALTEFWINGDEGTYYFVAHAPRALARIMIAVNAHPPLYYQLLQAIAFASEDFVWLRVPSLFFGSLSIFAMYLLGREADGEVCGVAAALATALSPGAVVLSHVVRPYAFQNFLIVSALLFLFRYLRQRSARDLWLYAGCMLVALFVQYGSFLSLGGIVLFLTASALTRRLDSRALRDLCLAHAPLLLAGALLFGLHIRPNLMGSDVQAHAVTGWLAGHFIAGPGDAWRNFLGLFDYLAGARLAAVAAVAFFAGIATSLVDRRYEFAGLCAGVLLVSVALSALSLYPFGGTRHSFHLAPLIALPIAYGVARVVSRGVKVVAVTAAVAAVLVLAAGRIEAVLGFPGDREPPPPELEIPRREVEGLRTSIEAIAETPGIIIMDIETNSMLSPFLREAYARMRWSGAPVVLSFRWGERHVVLDSAWRMQAGLANHSSPEHLAALLRRVRKQTPELAEFLDRDVRVISSDGMRILRSIRGLALTRPQRDALVDEVVRSPHFSIFRLNVALYRETLAARVRESREPNS